MFPVLKNRSTWNKNKTKIIKKIWQGWRLEVDRYDQVNRIVFKWFKRMRSENVPISGSLVKEKVLYFVNKQIFEIFKLLMDD